MKIIKQELQFEESLKYWGWLKIILFGDELLFISIPLSILFAIICLSLNGETLNIMTLSGMALAIGMLVDNSTVVLENILRNKEIYKTIF